MTSLFQNLRFIRLMVCKRRRLPRFLACLFFALSALHFNVLSCAARHCIVFLQCDVLHCTVFYCTALLVILIVMVTVGVSVIVIVILIVIVVIPTWTYIWNMYNDIPILFVTCIMTSLFQYIGLTCLMLRKRIQMLCKSALRAVTLMIIYFQLFCYYYLHQNDL